MKHAYSIATPDVDPAAKVFGLSGNFEENLRRIKAAGFEGVELITCRPKDLDMGWLEDCLQRHSLDAVMIATGEIAGAEGLSLSSPDRRTREKTVERFSQFTELAARLGADINIGRSRGTLLPGEEKKTTDRNLVDSFRRISENAAGAGVRYALEPVAPQLMNYINNVEEVMEYIVLTGYDNFSYMLDTQHMFLGEPDPLEVIRRCGKGALHVHLTDSQRNYPGSGEIPFDRFIEAFAKAGYDRAFSHESLPVPDMYTCMERSMAHIKPILERYYRKGGE